MLQDPWFTKQLTVVNSDIQRERERERESRFMYHIVRMGR